MTEYRSLNKPYFTSFDEFLKQIQDECHSGWELLQVLDGQRTFRVRAILKKTKP